MKLWRKIVLGGTVAVLGSAIATAAKELTPLELARELNEAFIEVADKVSPSVVVIDVTLTAPDNSQDDSSPDPDSWWDALPPSARRYFHHGPARPRKQQAEGSGIVVSPDGYILTNEHVVDGAEMITVIFKDGRRFVGVVRGADPVSDIAVVKINATGLTAAKLGDSDATRVGEFVLAIGAPFELSYSVTSGHISAKGRNFEDLASRNYDQEYLQTDASINPGNSGGPLVNLYGEVIGINTMIEGMNTGIGFAIPINTAKNVMPHLIEQGKYSRSWLGIMIQDLRNDRDYQGLEEKLSPDASEGAVVEEIGVDGPAARSDLRAGDVITAIDGRTVGTSRELKNLIAGKTPGHRVTLTVVRGKEHLKVTVTPELLPDDQQSAATNEHSAQGEIASATLGLTVQGLTRDLAAQFGVEQSQGVLITSVEQGSVADDKGLKPGDIVTEIDRKPIGSPRQFREALKAANLKRGLLMIVITGESSRFVVLRESAP